MVAQLPQRLKSTFFEKKFSLRFPPSGLLHSKKFQKTLILAFVANSALSRQNETKIVKITHSEYGDLLEFLTFKCHSFCTIIKCFKSTYYIASYYDFFLETAIKEEDEPVSPPPQAEPVPLISEQVLASSKNSPPTSTLSNNSNNSGGNSTTRLSETQRILPPSEPRKTGTCYFCKKSFMKNKQLMNHVCPKKPKSK